MITNNVTLIIKGQNCLTMIITNYYNRLYIFITYIIFSLGNTKGKSLAYRTEDVFIHPQKELNQTIR